MDKPAKCKVRQWMVGCNPSPSRRRADVSSSSVYARWDVKGLEDATKSKQYDKFDMVDGGVSNADKAYTRTSCVTSHF